MPTSASSRHLGETNEMVKMIQTRADLADQGAGMGQFGAFVYHRSMLVSVDSGRSIDMGRGGRLEPQQSPTAAYASSASSAFASFRSAVSKPSVKQPEPWKRTPSNESRPRSSQRMSRALASRLMGRDEAGLRGGFQIFRVIGVCMTRRWRKRDSNPRSRTRRYRFECRPELIGSCGF